MRSATIKASTEGVSRTFTIPEDCSFYELHRLIQDIFGWCELHPHRFVVDGRNIGIGFLGDSEEILETVGGHKGEMRYIYGPYALDLVYVGTDKNGPKVPKVLSCEGIAPPDGIGALGDFDSIGELTEAYGDPNSPMHEEAASLYMHLLGPHNVEKVNKYLSDNWERQGPFKVRIRPDVSVDIGSCLLHGKYAFYDTASDSVVGSSDGSDRFVPIDGGIDEGVLYLADRFASTHGIRSDDPFGTILTQYGREWEEYTEDMILDVALDWAKDNGLLVDDTYFDGDTFEEANRFKDLGQ